MAKLTLTSRGQVTFRKEVLRHLEVKPGEKIELEYLPGGKVAGRTKVKLTIEQIKEATERAWAGER